MNANIERQTQLQIRYLRNMQIIKWRIRAIKDIRTNKCHTTYSATNVEFCALQIRKILELIALSSLISDLDVYREQLNDIEKKWNARLILQDIERIHPNFYPVPIEIDPDNKYRWLDKKTPYLTKEQFVSIYKKCGKILHEDSVFKDDKDMDSTYNQADEQINNWVLLIMNLLNTHTVHLYNKKDLFYITMGGENDRPRGNIFTLVEEEPHNGQAEI